jgi:type II secretory pathway component PulF
MEYNYQARDEAGKLQLGTVEAPSADAASGILQQHNLFVVKISPVSKYGSLDTLNIFERVSAKDLVLFSRQLATLIGAKVPIVQALRILHDQVTSRKLKKVIWEVSQHVESGDSLSTAISRYPKVFSSLYVNLIRSGELSGSLETSLGYLANQIEKNYDLRSKIIGSLTYPLFVVFALIIVGFLMFIYVLPPLVSILQEQSVSLPFTTQILIAVTNFVNHFWWLIILLVVGAIVAYRRYIHSEAGRYFVDGVKVKLPIFGSLFMKIYMSRFSRNLATMIAGGIPIVKALEAVSGMMGNEVYKNICMEAAAQVRNGKGIAVALANHGDVPPLVTQMIGIGEATGRLQEVLEKVADFYEKEVDEVLKNLTTLIEPIIILLLGLAVATMVAGILLPIYNLASAQ